mmetsp:Transcript_33848/g.101006  ORF Transcript_33848/g.101006 Transcript_33848/m.101006 type:complete len:228 (+) Transcript_33848:87-770(+)
MAPKRHPLRKYCSPSCSSLAPPANLTYSPPFKPYPLSPLAPLPMQDSKSCSTRPASPSRFLDLPFCPVSETLPPNSDASTFPMSNHHPMQPTLPLLPDDPLASSNPAQQKSSPLHGSSLTALPSSMQHIEEASTWASPSNRITSTTQSTCPCSDTLPTSFRSLNMSQPSARIIPYAHGQNPSTEPNPSSPPQFTQQNFSKPQPSPASKSPPTFSTPKGTNHHHLSHQ